RSDVNVGNCDKAVFEVVHAIDVKTRSALIGMSRIGRRSKDSILDGVEADVEIRARVGARAQVGAESESSLSVDIATKGEVGGAAERLIVSGRKASALRARAAKRRRQESGSTIPWFDRNRRIRQIKHRNVFQFQFRRIDVHAVT